MERGRKGRREGGRGEGGGGIPWKFRDCFEDQRKLDWNFSMNPGRILECSNCLNPQKWNFRDDSRILWLLPPGNLDGRILFWCFHAGSPEDPWDSRWNLVGFFKILEDSWRFLRILEDSGRFLKIPKDSGRFSKGILMRFFAGFLKIREDSWESLRILEDSWRFWKISENYWGFLKFPRDHGRFWRILEDSPREF